NGAERLGHLLVRRPHSSFLPRNLPPARDGHLLPTHIEEDGRLRGRRLRQTGYRVAGGERGRERICERAFGQLALDLLCVVGGGGAGGTQEGIERCVDEARANSCAYGECRSTDANPPKCPLERVSRAVLPVHSGLWLGLYRSPGIQFVRPLGSVL